MFGMIFHHPAPIMHFPVTVDFSSFNKFRISLTLVDLSEFLGLRYRVLMLFVSVFLLYFKWQL